MTIKEHLDRTLVQGFLQHFNVREISFLPDEAVTVLADLLRTVVKENKGSVPLWRKLIEDSLRSFGQKPKSVTEMIEDCLKKEPESIESWPSNDLTKAQVGATLYSLKFGPVTLVQIIPDFLGKTPQALRCKNLVGLNRIWTIQGKLDEEDHTPDLFLTKPTILCNIAPKVVKTYTDVRYLNIYQYGPGAKAFPSRTAADRAASPNRLGEAYEVKINHTWEE